MNATEVPTCPDCRQQHMGACGGLSIAARIRSVRLTNEATPTRTKRNWFDSGAADDLFGADRVDRYYDETQGHGALSRDDIETIDPTVLDEVYLGANNVTEGDDTIMDEVTNTP